MTRVLDKIDQRILEELKSNGRLSIVELAARINLTNTPCSERVKRLEKEGFITGYRADLDMDKLGRGHVTVVQVSLSVTGGDTVLSDFNEAVRAIPEVESCLMLAGPFDYLLTVRTGDMQEYRQLLGERINKLPSLSQTSSLAVMEVVK